MKRRLAYLFLPLLLAAACGGPNQSAVNGGEGSGNESAGLEPGDLPPMPKPEEAAKPSLEMETALQPLVDRKVLPNDTLQSALANARNWRAAMDALLRIRSIADAIAYEKKLQATKEESRRLAEAMAKEKESAALAEAFHRLGQSQEIYRYRQKGTGQLYYTNLIQHGAKIAGTGKWVFDRVVARVYSAAYQECAKPIQRCQRRLGTTSVRVKYTAGSCGKGWSAMTGGNVCAAYNSMTAMNELKVYTHRQSGAFFVTADPAEVKWVEARPKKWKPVEALGFTL